MLGLSPNQVTLIGAFGGAALGAVIGGVVSFFVARYTLKHGANYSGQIETINATLASLASTQEAMKQQHAQSVSDEKQRHEESERRAEAARWKPEARIESKRDGSVQVNTLILKSSQEFHLISVSLIAPNGAKLLDYPVTPSFSSTGFGIPVTHESLNRVAELSPTWAYQETFSGAIRYVVERDRDPARYSADLAFHGKRIIVVNTCYFELSG